MRFGSQEIFDFIVDNLDTEDFEWYNDLYEVIKEDTKQILLKRCDHFDDDLLDDITQDVALEVYRRLVGFVEHSAGMTDGQRNSWLKSVIRSKLSDFFNGEENNISIEDTDINIEAIISSENDAIASYDKKENKEIALIDSLKYLFSLNTTPDKIMAFVFSKLIYTYGTGNVNGQARKVADDFAETSLSEMFQKMYAELKDILFFDIPDDVFSPLINKINKTDSFALTARKITLGSNWISGEMKKNKENIFNSEEE